MLRKRRNPTIEPHHNNRISNDDTKPPHIIPSLSINPYPVQSTPSISSSDHSSLKESKEKVIKKPLKKWATVIPHLGRRDDGSKHKRSHSNSSSLSISTKEKQSKDSNYPYDQAGLETPRTSPTSPEPKDIENPCKNCQFKPECIKNNVPINKPTCKNAGFRKIWPHMALKRHLSQNPTTEQLAAYDKLDPPKPPPKLKIYSMYWENDSEKPPSPAYIQEPENIRNFAKSQLDGRSDSSRRISTGSSTTATSSASTTNSFRRRFSCPAEYFVDHKEDDSNRSLNLSDLKERSTPNYLMVSVPLSERGSDCRLMYKVPVPDPLKPQSRESSFSIVSTSSSSSNRSSTGTIYNFQPEDKKSTKTIPDLINPDTKEPILRFQLMKPRAAHLKRKTSVKRETKALYVWRTSVENMIQKEPRPPKSIVEWSPEKQQKHALTRRFILQEFYTTEVTFWNQLYFSKVMFYDPICEHLDRGSPFIKPKSVEPFANLFDMMQLSANIIERFRYKQSDQSKNIKLNSVGSVESYRCQTNICIGKHLVDLSEGMVAFLRHALDYKSNRKLLESCQTNKIYKQYREKLYIRKETRSFTLSDYLIIPIQRVARYGLLLADLAKHTSPNHPDYEYIFLAHKIVTGLATAMNYAQK
ncbi:Dbl homology domain-containing protein [Phycomyces nitens]|nr:Dbl homology domain-containing protein [Phycomyces nitens]